MLYRLAYIERFEKKGGEGQGLNHTKVAPLTTGIVEHKRPGATGRLCSVPPREVPPGGGLLSAIVRGPLRRETASGGVK